MKRYKLTEAAKMLGVNEWTLRRWVYAGKAPVIHSDSGRAFLPEWWIKQQTGDATAEKPDASIRVALYVRESSSENKAALESQKGGLVSFATAKGWTIAHVVCEFGSGINDSRKKLHALLKLKDFDILLVEHKDRLTRFGFRWFEALAPFKIEVVNLPENDTHDLMEDLVAVITSFAARLYGQRRGRAKTKAAVKALEEN